MASAATTMGVIKMRVCIKLITRLRVNHLFCVSPRARRRRAPPIFILGILEVFAVCAL